MGTAKYHFPILLCLISGLWALPRVDPLVDTKVGLIRGLTAPDGEYSMFLGIPYATVDPSNPFGQSIPHSGFEGTFDAFDDSAICPQVEEFNNTIVGSLDCLHLNVYVPNTASSRNRRPVLVWIHGGGFQFGFSGRYVHGPRFLVQHDVIVVTLNYRLGAYGFFCLDTPDIPGNQGLKDQLTALRWIKNNIDAFSGDSEQITIVGESAGGASVDFHFIYTEEDLFNKVILQSGTALSPFSITEANVNAPLRLAEHLGFIANNLDEALQFLHTVDSDLIVAATSEMSLLLSPCVEKEFDNVERFITSHPINVNMPKATNVPVLIGFNNNELGFQLENMNPEEYELLSDYFLNFLKANFNFNDEYLVKMEENVRQFYIGDEEISENVKTHMADFASDFYFYHPSYRSIQKYFDNGASTIYHYMFSYDGERNFNKASLNSSISGAVHADEISYLFDVSFMNETPTSEDQLIIDRITTLWTNFAKYSNPTPEVTELLPVEWPPLTPDTMSYLDIDYEISIQQRPFHARMAYWNLFYKLNKSFQKGFEEN